MSTLNQRFETSESYESLKPESLEASSSDSEESNEKNCKRTFKKYLKALQVPGIVLFTIGDFFGLLVIIAVIIHVIVLVGTIATFDPDNKVAIIFGLIFMVLFGLQFANVIIINIINFIRLPHIHEGIFTQRGNTIHPAIGKVMKKIFKILLRVFYLVFSILFLITLIASLLFGKQWGYDTLDYLFIIMIAYFPLVRYLAMILCYTVHSWISLFIPFKEIPSFARYEIVLFNIYRQSNLCNIKNSLYSWVWELIHILVMIATNIYLIFILLSSGKCGTFCSGFISMFVLIVTPLSIRIRFPFYVIHSIFDYFISKYNNGRKVISFEKILSKKISSINYKKRGVRTVTPLTMAIISAGTQCVILIVCCAIIFFIGTNVAFKQRIYQPYKINLTAYNELKQKIPIQTPSSNYAKSPICYLAHHGISMIQFIILSDIVYADLNSTESKTVLNDFFAENQISRMGQMNLSEYKFGSMAYFNFDESDLTVVVIRGSKEGIDWALDVQFFLSSALLTVATPLSFFTSDLTPTTTDTIKTVLAFPLILLHDITLFDNFYQSLDQYYQNDIPFNSNVIIVGHSLGGGLAKLFGYTKGKSSISVSGPGITLFQSFIKGNISRINSVMSSLDIVPDGDIVPRVEQSAGSEFRTLCNQSVSLCHNAKHTVCMASLMCQTPHEAFCRSLEDIAPVYDGMIDYANGLI